MPGVIKLDMGGKYRALLNKEFQRRKERNRHYSLRSYARDLGLQPSQLSQVLKERQHLSPQSAGKVSKKIYGDKRRQNLFFEIYSLEASGSDDATIAKHSLLIEETRLLKLDQEIVVRLTKAQWIEFEERAKKFMSEISPIDISTDGDTYEISLQAQSIG